MAEPVAELRYEGRLAVRPYRRGTFLWLDHLEELIERALGGRYSYGKGWDGHGVVSISFYAGQPDPGNVE
jgi:hypothetical protein